MEIERFVQLKMINIHFEKQKKDKKLSNLGKNRTVLGFFPVFSGSTIPPLRLLIYLNHLIKP